ncbi:Ku protein [Cupriavidus malaysiensis]|uniref:Non-homologous end joining protein Ku n=1 Tax=Cupriavidus malaysiensis TaxID=367825 RepID=A0ABM6FF83_9BURK|nr:Ku protein [Cupriavidus malaysiensis]AOZ10585.1 Ku protein [Cupriavidus malaysiensis]
MAARSMASLSLTFGLVSIPVNVYSATESKDAVSFHLLHKGCGSRLKQQYVCLREDVVVERDQMVKGYEFDKGRYVIFEPDELKALEDSARHTVDIVAFLPVGTVDPIFYEKAYYLGPDKRGAKPYSLLAEAMRKTGMCALATWVWKGKQYMVQIRPAGGGLVLQQLYYANEIREIADLHIEQMEVAPAELKLAEQLIGQNAVEGYDPGAYEDEEKKRILAAIDKKIAGKKITVSEETPRSAGAEVIDLMGALRASLARKRPEAGKAAAPAERKGAKRAAAPSPVPARSRRAAKK